MNSSWTPVTTGETIAQARSLSDWKTPTSDAQAKSDEFLHTSRSTRDSSALLVPGLVLSGMVMGGFTLGMFGHPFGTWLAKSPNILRLFNFTAKEFAVTTAVTGALIGAIGGGIGGYFLSGGTPPSKIEPKDVHEIHRQVDGVSNGSATKEFFTSDPEAGRVLRQNGTDPRLSMGAIADRVFEELDQNSNGLLELKRRGYEEAESGTVSLHDIGSDQILHAKKLLQEADRSGNQDDAVDRGELLEKLGSYTSAKTLKRLVSESPKSVEYLHFAGYFTQGELSYVPGTD